MVARSSVADVIYRAILRLYPARFQEDFASDMALDFADASDEAWIERRWTGLIGVWAGSAVDVARSLTLQWMRTHVPLIVHRLDRHRAYPRRPSRRRIAPKGTVFRQRRIRTIASWSTLILLTACVVLVIASTIIFTHWFLRPLLYRGSSRRR